MFSLKLCGKRHAHCKVCRPDLISSNTTRFGGSNFKHRIKFCGKRHASCNVCRPDVGQAISSLRKRLGLNFPVYAHHTNQTSFGGSEFKFKVKACGKAHAHCGICRPEMNKAHFTGRNHSDAARVRMSTTHKSVEHTAEWNAAVSRGVKRHRESRCDRACCLPARSPTSLEYALQMLLEDASLEFEAQKRFGRYVVDAWVPSHKLVFEADGKWWHQDKEADKKRQSELEKIGWKFLRYQDRIPSIKELEKDLRFVGRERPYVSGVLG